jgi:ATP adenylyltransferase
MDWPNLWAPWRNDYVKSIPPESEVKCFLCAAWQNPAEDAHRLVIHREEAGLILMNRYPYTTGHLLVIPADHLGDLLDLTPPQRAALMELTAMAERLIRAVLNPQGINIGINIGRCAGAGLPGHLHVHLVPRWGGDTNFMHVVGQVRVIPQAMEQVYAEFKAGIKK